MSVNQKINDIVKEVVDNNNAPFILYVEHKGKIYSALITEGRVSIGSLNESLSIMNAAGINCRRCGGTGTEPS